MPAAAVAAGMPKQLGELRGGGVAERMEWDRDRGADQPLRGGGLDA